MGTRMMDLMLLSEALWIALWIGAQPAEVALLYAAGFYASMYAAAQVAPWLVLHLSITQPVLQWMAEHAEANVPVFGEGLVRRSMRTPSQISGQIHWTALHALDWTMALFLGAAVWCAFMGVHRFLQSMLDEDEPAEVGGFSRWVSGLIGASVGLWSMLQAAPTLAALLHLFGSAKSLESNPLLDLILHGLQALSAVRTMI
ncbi:hypothetical protein [Alicyclobacillus sendaiensis]|uniref:hypothetical protein n=1 Tax=Alicyclobacillus sendaiensis TaxID=192387 RepID=UPI0026F47D82|nr:hypothetical protein [Alicyclobacillus sendaiensis]